jgi:hypothetical protein
MRSLLSVLVLASALVLLVPDHGAQAVNAAEASFSPAAAISSPVASAEREVPEGPAGVDSDASWLLALGFLGAVMARRLRAD